MTSVISGLLVGHSGMYWVLILAIGVTLAAIIHLFFVSLPEKRIFHNGEHPVGASAKEAVSGHLIILSLNSRNFRKIYLERNYLLVYLSFLLITQKSTSISLKLFLNGVRSQCTVPIKICMYRLLIK